MKIALPISQYFEQVKTELLPLIGAVVARKESHLKEDFKDKDVLFHTNGLIDDDFGKVADNQEFLEKLQTFATLFSFDLGPSCCKVDCSEDDGYIAKSPVLTESQIFRIADKRINNIRKYFKGVISVENLDYHSSGACEIVCVPEFIDRFVKEFDVGLTLDIGHAEVTCDNLSMDIYDYLKRMPLSKVTEIHLTHASGGEDLHMLPTDKEYKLLDFVLSKSRADYIAIEYYFDTESIINGNRQLAQFLENRGGAR